jgi:redox-sensitive bicupin YhaK (pirin superfamily)
MIPNPDGPVFQTFPLGPQWPVIDPFLFAAHHRDDYPESDGHLGPAPSLAGRQIGNDFSGDDGWSMYHGLQVPGFPQHPHRGFETVTHIRFGLVDHADSLGATARFGPGDTQWMTAGSGIQHSEMFPLIDTDLDNPLEMFQIWLNLPADDKMVDPYFTMMWREQTPQVNALCDQPTYTEITVIAGQLGPAHPNPPPPNSWAANPDSDVAIWHIQMGRNASWTLPAASGPNTHRVLYLYDGDMLTLTDDCTIGESTGAIVDANKELLLRAGSDGAFIIMLQGRPLGEPIAQRGPFVMNTEEQLVTAFQEYRATQFGGWPWSSPDPTHGDTPQRFAIHADGTREVPDEFV